MSYPLLKRAPPQGSPKFIDFLRDNNVVVFENAWWIVIENCKYHTKEKPWYTAFWKFESRGFPEVAEWYEDADVLWHEFSEYEWLKKSPSEQTVPDRFHIHLIKK